MHRMVPNSNGDTAATLAEQLTDAKLAILKAARAVNRMSPHGRNYQTLAEGSAAAFAQDCEEVAAMRSKLLGYADEIERAQIRLARATA
jgi:hypothetical protein